VGELYAKAEEFFKEQFEQVQRLLKGVTFLAGLQGSKVRRAILSLYPADSDTENGLLIFIYLDRLAEYLGQDKETIISNLPPLNKREYKGWVDGEISNVYLKNEEEIDRFLSLFKSL